MDKNDLRFFLMHKDIVIAQMEIDDARPHKITFTKDASEHLPLGAQMNMMLFHEWWKDRAVPRTRQGARSALKRLGYPTTGHMLVDNLALSLTDCYWIKPFKADISWSDVSLFINPFVDYFGEITINSNADVGRRSRFSLATSQGEVRKKWVIRTDGTRAMVKGNWADTYQQSINEAFASLMHRLQGVMPYTEYELLPLETKDDKDGLGCICNLFTNEETEFVSAWEVLCNAKKRGSDSYYSHFRKQCLRHGMDEEYFERFMSYEILIDILITNTDRHMNNIGILRDPVTLKWKGFAPIYDNGNSMFFRLGDLRHVQFDEIKISSFLNREQKMLRYVKYPEIVDVDKLPTKDEFESLYRRDRIDRHVRIEDTWRLFERKVNMVYTFQRKNRSA